MSFIVIFLFLFLWLFLSGRTYRGVFLFVYKTYILICFLAVCAFLSPRSTSTSHASVGGTVGLRYIDYEISGSSSNNESAKAFYEDYSLIAMKNGNIYNRRGGPYSLTVTYDHLKYYTDLKNVEYSPVSSFLGWNGDLLLSMPHIYGLNLNLYSLNKRNTRRNHINIAADSLSHGLVYDLEFVDTKNNGFNLSLGVNGGPYYHLYGYSFDRQFSDDPSEEFSRLGFALQYGVNFLHLYYDKEEPLGISKRTLIFGNIALPQVVVATPETTEYGLRNTSVTRSASDHLGSYAPAYAPKRLWYRLTNWLDVSADFLFSDEEGDVEDISTKRLSIALDGDLGRTNIGTYAFHERIDSDLKSKRTLHLPLWVDTRLSPETSLYFSNKYVDTETEDLLTLSVARSRTLTDRITLTSDLKGRLYMETGYVLKKSGLAGVDMESHSIYFDGYTRRKGPLNYSLLYRFDTAMRSDASYDGRISYSNLFNGSVTYNLIQKQLRFRLLQGYLSAYERNKLPSERYERFNTTLNIDYQPSGTTHSVLDIGRSNLVYEDGAEALQNMVHLYVRKEINGKLKVAIDVDYSDSKEDLDGVNKEFTRLGSLNHLRYKLVRSLESDTSLLTSQTKSKGGASNSSFKLGEELKYIYSTKGFNRRALFDIAGSAWYKKSKIGGGNYEDNWLEMKINYYPTRYFTCGAAYSSENDSTIINKKLYAALSYPLLTLKGSYSQQLHKDADRKEDLYKIDFTKRF